MGLTIEICNARPHHYRHNDKHHHGNIGREADKKGNPGKPSVIIPLPDFLMSSHVILAADPPLHPPADMALSTIQDNLMLHNSMQADLDALPVHFGAGDDLEQNDTNTLASDGRVQIADLKHILNNGYKNSNLRRDKRSLGEATKEDGITKKEAKFAEPVCRSRSQWVTKLTSNDIWGNMVNIEQTIDNNGQQIHQYFYETFCETSVNREGSRQWASCKGVDEKRYTSVCRDQFSWVYAFVSNATGDIGWSMVKIHTSCGCALITTL